MTIIVGWLFLSAMAATFAQQRRNRNGFGWLIVALIFSPLVAFILLAILPSLPKKLPPKKDLLAAMK